MSEIHVVRLVLSGHQHQGDSIDELHPVQGVDPHIHEDPVQHWHRDELEYRRQFYGQSG